MTTKTIFPVILTAIYAVGLLFAGQWSENLGFAVSENKYLSRQFNYQTILLLITAFSILTTYLLNKQNFANYFSFGQISAAGQELKLLGIKQGDSWTKTGLSLSIIISLVTATFLYFQLKQANPNWISLQSGILWIVLFSLTNSFGEEMIFRLGIVSPLRDQLLPTTIFLISGVLFAIPHFAGMPDGIVGVTLAGILGFILAKSMHETNGFFWAWLIHFLQDVIIIGSLFLLNENSGR